VTSAHVAGSGVTVAKAAVGGGALAWPFVCENGIGIGMGIGANPHLVESLKVSVFVSIGVNGDSAGRYTVVVSVIRIVSTRTTVMRSVSTRLVSFLIGMRCCDLAAACCATTCACDAHANATNKPAATVVDALFMNSSQEVRAPFRPAGRLAEEKAEFSTFMQGQRPFLNGAR
jgi:hypothetical protein